MINKQRRKQGLFGIGDKTSFQRNLRTDELLKLSQKNKLTKNDEKRLTGVRAIHGKSIIKQGTNINKGMKQNTPFNKNNTSPQESGAIGNGPANNLNQELNTSSKLSISQFLGSSPTGVYSKQDLKKGVNKFVNELKGTPSVQNVSFQKQGGVAFGKIIVDRDYQKATFKFNPNQLSFSTQGWKLDIPKNFIKKSDTHFVSPLQERSVSFYSNKSGNETRRRKQTAAYTPVEIFLNEENKNKISKIINRGVYENYYNMSKSGNDKSTRYTDNTYLTGQELFYNTGNLKQKKDWDDYTYDYYRNKRGKNNDEATKIKGTYLRDQWDYNPSGYLTQYQGWRDYAKTNRYNASGSRDSSNERIGGIYLQNKQEFNDKGKMLRQRQWNSYINNEKIYSGATHGYNQSRAIQLQRDKTYNAGNKVSDFKYRTYTTGINTKTSDRVMRLRDTGFGGLDNLSSLNRFGTTPRTKRYLNSDNSLKKGEDKKIFVEPIKTKTIKKDTALQEVTFYDPFNGDIVESFKFW